MDDFRERVVEEKRELDGKLQRLEAFIAGKAFDAINPGEQNRLVRQRDAMCDYSGILGDRIANFS